MSREPRQRERRRRATESSSASLRIDVHCSVRRVSPRSAAALRDVASFVCGAERLRRGALSISVVNARRMAALHRAHCGVRGATDVLTFDLGSAPRRGLVDGEVVVCFDVALRRAGRQRVDAELALYVVHGILHLAGYDDHAPRDFAKMHGREDELLTAFGIGRVFG